MPSRAVPPSPLNLRGSGEASPHRQDSFGSDYSDKDKDVRESTSSSQFDDHHRMLGGHSTPTRKFTGSSSKPHSPTVNVYTHCGRHSDQYLFSGWSHLFRKE
ncbi:hypothetical protein F4819DRAFT_293900 [Hypoxylon fuscum]|nr:hypothetical protein F4819DRAFT_293900 [Hypoxylon fuscum]